MGLILAGQLFTVSLQENLILGMTNQLLLIIIFIHHKNNKKISLLIVLVTEDRPLATMQAITKNFKILFFKILKNY